MNNIFIIFVGALYWAWAILSSNPKLLFLYIYARLLHVISILLCFR